MTNNGGAFEAVLAEPDSFIAQVSTLIMIWREYPSGKNGEKPTSGLKSVEWAGGFRCILLSGALIE